MESCHVSVSTARLRSSLSCRNVAHRSVMACKACHCDQTSSRCRRASHDWGPKRPKLTVAQKFTRLAQKQSLVILLVLCAVALDLVARWLLLLFVARVVP